MNFRALFQITGPVDIEQLQLENANLVEVLQSKNRQLVDARRSIGSARVKKHKFQGKLRQEQVKESELKGKIKANDQEIPGIMDKIGELIDEIDRQNTKCMNLQQMMREFEVPTVDVYIELKLSLERIEKREDQMLRKQCIEALKSKNDKVKKVRERNLRRPPSKLSRKPTKNFTIPGRLFHGKTFNIVYKPEVVKSPRKTS